MRRHSLNFLAVFLFLPNQQTLVPHWIHLNGDGSMIVGGIARSYHLLRENNGIDTQATGFLGKLTPSGILDKSFGANGWVTFSKSDFPTDVKVLSDGRIVVAGSRWVKASDTAFWIARFLPSGRPDPGFGDKGEVVVDFSDGEECPDGILVHPDGKLTALGITHKNVIYLRGVSSWVAAVRLTPDGKLDPTFGDKGKIFRRGPAEDYGMSFVFARRDGGFLLLGQGYARGKEFATWLTDQPLLLALTDTGQADKSFAPEGLRQITSLGKVWVASALQIEDGSILLTGDFQRPSEEGGFVAKLLPNGLPDPSFGTNGIAKLPIYGRDLVQSGETFFISGAGMTPGRRLKIVKVSFTGIVGKVLVQKEIEGSHAKIALDRVKGRIAVAATRETRRFSQFPGYSSELGIARFNSDGTEAK